MSAMAPAYPVTYEVADAAPQNRLSVLLRVIFFIPHYIIIYFLQIALGVILFLAWFAILFTGRYPEGMLRFSIGGVRWQSRGYGYLSLLTDKYPPFSLDDDPAYPIRFNCEERVEGRNRLTTFWPIRWLMALPHLVILMFLGVAAFVVILLAWFAALFTGSVPPGLHNFLVGVGRWNQRVTAYIYDLVDEYPPFSMS